MCLYHLYTFNKTLLEKVSQKNTFRKSVAKKHFWEKCGKILHF